MPLRLALATLLAAVLAALAPALASGKVLRYASQDDVQTVDPHAANLLTSSRVTGNLYEALVWRDKDWKVIPWLAVRWSQPDAKTWRFHLRDGVKFHDGAPFSADDVVFSAGRALHPLSQMRISLQGVEKVTKIDRLTVDFALREPNPVLLSHLTQLRIMNKAWAVKHGATLPQDYKAREDTYAARHANGTGAFRLKEYQPDVRLVLVAHADWWGRAAGVNESNLTEVVMRPIKSNATRLAALLSGEVDFVVDPATQDVARLRADPGIRIAESAELRVQYLAFDLHRDELLHGSERRKNPFKDVRVRRAVAHAIDAEAIRAKVMRGFSKPIGALIAPGIDGYSPEGDIRLPFDRARAKALLAEAGYPDGFEVTLDAGNIQPAADIAQAVAAMLAQVGIRTRANIVPQPTYFPKIERYDTSFYLLSWGGGLTADAYYTLQTLLHTRTAQGEGDFNLGRWTDPRADALLARLRVEPDAGKRREITRDILQLAAAELPAVPIHQPLIPWAMRKNVSAQVTPVNTLYFYRTRID